jgi:hypothetical protein
MRHRCAVISVEGAFRLIKGGNLRDLSRTVSWFSVLALVVSGELEF